MERIDSVRMVRKIRDRQNEDIKGKSPRDIIKYFRGKAGEFVSRREVETKKP